MQFEFGLVAYLSVGVYQSLQLAGVLLFTPRQNRLANRLMAALVLINGFRLTFQLSLHLPFGINWAPIAPLNLPLTMLYGPMLYLYIKSFIQRDFKLDRKTRLHFLPAALGFLLASFLPLILGLDQPDPFNPYETSHIPPRIWIVASIAGIYNLVYFSLTLIRIWRFYQYVKFNASNSNIQYFRWMVLITFLILAPAFSMVATIMLTETPAITQIYPALVSCLIICLLGILVLVNPDPINGIPSNLQVEDEEELVAPKYSSSSLTEEQKEHMLAQLQNHMQAQQPYLNPTLTLKTLADQLPLNAKYLSQIINEKLDQNFLDFINTYRIERAKDLLKHPAYTHYTILAIAQEVGFKSKSTFYTAFKKFTQLTPTQYKEAIKQPEAPPQLS